MIEFNFKFVLKSAIGGNGLDESEIRSLKFELARARDYLYELRKRREIGFYDEISKTGLLTEIKGAADKVFSGKIDTLFVFGMGGSSLGGIFLQEALGRVGRIPGRDVIFSENIDPFHLHRQLDGIDVEKTMFCFVSKSANTIETVSQFFIILDILKKSVSDYKSHLMFITDKESGFLRRFADENGILTLDIPKNIGGRYSIVTAGTLFPAHVMGFDIEKFLHGAVLYRDQSLNRNIFENNPLYTMAAVIYLFYKRKNRNILVINPYTDYLREFSRWFRQLFAESLGKNLLSPTPVPAVGATDQHSQLQLYMQGPQDKLISFFYLKNPGQDFKISPGEFKEFNYLNGRNLSNLLLNELKGVEYALAINRRPSFRITIDKIDEFTMGELSFMCMEAVAVLGMLLEINPFDQPGVEKGKKFSYLLMGKEAAEEGEEVSEMKRLDGIPDMPY